MARELNSLFMANPPVESQRHRVFSLQDFPPIPVPGTFPPNPNTFEPLRGVPTYQNNFNNYPVQNNYYGGPPPQPANEAQHSTKGYGKITWLSSKAGLITNQDGTTISFQAKEFCDQGVNDLLQVLRVGFTLKYHAIMSDGEQYTATQAIPIHGPEADEVFKNATEINLEAENPTPANAKDTYCPELEREAYEALLATFQRQATNKLQLSNFSLHSQISNQGDERLFRYVGSSSMKRRTFVERRTHIFFINNEDSIYLQYPAIYHAVYLLSTYLLTRGGVASVQDLFEYYVSNAVEPSIREYVGSNHQDFMALLAGHPFAFAVFPSKSYVSARRNLPNYDYAGFIDKNFASLYSPRRQHVYGQQQYNQPRGIQRTTSVPMGDGYGMGHHYNGHMQRGQYQHHNRYNGGNQQGRLASLLDNHLTSAHLENQWGADANLPLWVNNGSESSYDMYNETALANDFGNLMQLRNTSTRTTSTGTQADEPSNVQTCTCQCSCGRGRSGSVVSTRNVNAGTIGSSRALPTILPGVSNLSSNGFLGNRPLSISTASSDEQPPVTDSYNLFGPNNILSGSIDSLRFGNL